MIVDLGQLESVIETHVTDPFDHTFLNKDIAFFATVVPTAENIALRIQALLQDPIRALGVQLHKITLIESPNNACEVYCEENVEALRLSLNSAVLTPA
jgi:6-pyruvoyltetrahydropterin/6-carboxytetrahydropterin synthase